MNTLSLFDSPPAPPRARISDPSTSREAAERVKPGAAELDYAIRWWLGKQDGPRTAFDIAAALCGQRWTHQTVLTAVSRARKAEALCVVDECGASPSGSACRRYRVAS